LTEVIDAPILGSLVLEPTEHLDIDDASTITVRNAQAHVAGLLGALAEDGDDQALFGGELALTLRGDLPNQNIFRPDLRADPNDSILVEVLEHILADIGDVARYLFRPELGVAGFDVELLDMDRGEHVVLDEPFREENSVLVVIT